MCLRKALRSGTENLPGLSLSAFPLLLPACVLPLVLSSERLLFFPGVSRWKRSTPQQLSFVFTCIKSSSISLSFPLPSLLPNIDSRERGSHIPTLGQDPILDQSQGRSVEHNLPLWGGVGRLKDFELGRCSQKHLVKTKPKTRPLF